MSRHRPPSLPVRSLLGEQYHQSLIPIGIGGLAYVVGGRYPAYLSLLAFGIARLVGFGTSGFQTGAWQYDIAAPLVFLTFAAVHQSITRTGLNADRWAAGAGVTLGILGMTQWTLTLFTIVILTVAYLAMKRFRTLVMTGVVSAVFASHLLFLPSSSNGLMFSGFLDRILPASGGLIQPSHTLMTITTPGFWVITVGVVTVTAYQLRQNQLLTDSAMLSAAIGVLYLVYLAAAVFRLNYIDWVVVQILIPVVYIAGSTVAWRTATRVRQSNNPVLQPFRNLI